MLPRLFPSASRLRSVGACFFALALSFRWGVPAEAKEPPSTLLTKVPVLPLAIDPAFEFRKKKLFLLDNETQSGILRPSQEPSLAFERRRLLYGAISGSDIRNRYGNYFTFFWRAKRRANLTLRLEYRQRKLGAYLQAREVEYPAARGSYTTHFQITGDEYSEQGGVVQWRAILIEDHRMIVALTQSYLWR